MKHLLIMIIALVALFATAEAQKLESVRPFGSKAMYTITPTNDTITVTPKYSASIYVCPVDTNVYFFADTSAGLPGNAVYFKFTSDATKRYIYFKTGFEGVPAKDSIAASKTKIYQFVNSTSGKFTLMGKSSEY